MPAARNPIATMARQINGHSAMSQKQMFESEFLGLGFFFMLFSQAFEERHFEKIEHFSVNAWDVVQLLLGAIPCPLETTPSSKKQARRSSQSTV